MAKYLDFRIIPRPSERKTDIYDVWNKDGVSFLGRISWYGPWRRYCFYPLGRNPVFDAGCMLDIAEFMIDLMEKHKHKQEKANDT